MTITELSKLSDEELNVRLAELTGWEVKEDKESRLWTAENVRTGKISGYHAGISEEHCKRVCFPRFCSDLNAVHEVEKSLTDEQRNAYVNHLHDIAVTSEQQPQADFQWCCASARQRAEALYLTLTP